MVLEMPSENRQCRGRGNMGGQYILIRTTLCSEIQYAQYQLSTTDSVQYNVVGIAFLKIIHGPSAE